MVVNTFVCSLFRPAVVCEKSCLLPPEFLFRKAQHNGFALVVDLEAQAGYYSRGRKLPPVGGSFSLLACTFRRFKTLQILNLYFWNYEMNFAVLTLIWTVCQCHENSSLRNTQPFWPFLSPSHVFTFLLGKLTCTTLGDILLLLMISAVFVKSR